MELLQRLSKWWCEENSAANNKIHNNKTTINKSFQYNAKLIGSTPNNNNNNNNNNNDNNNTLNADAVVPLKYLSNFWRYLDLPLINCEIELDLPWSEEHFK